MAKRRALVIALSAVAALAAVALSLVFGSARLSISDVLAGLFRTGTNPTAESIVYAVRLPRCLGALLAGAGLGISGALLQSATGNSLAGPNIIGVNAGAGFSMVLISCLLPLSFRLAPLAAMAGAFACTAIIAGISARAGGSQTTVVLAGVAISTLFNAGISMLRLLYPESTSNYIYFSIGGFSGVSLDKLAVPAVIIALCFAASFCVGRRLDLFALGDPIARNLGVRVRALRVFALLLASAAAGAAVSFAGLLGFVGLMTPHIARRLLGCDNMRALLPASALVGAALTALADLAGRVAFAPSEVPAGVFLALLGVPFFLALLIKRRARA